MLVISRRANGLDLEQDAHRYCMYWEKMQTGHGEARLLGDSE